MMRTSQASTEPERSIMTRHSALGGLVVRPTGTQARDATFCRLREERLVVKAWQLLMMLPTNVSMRKELAALPSEVPPDWPRLLHAGRACHFDRPI